MYYYLQLEADKYIYDIHNVLRSYPHLFENTIIVFTSDHGDMIGAHGGMHQKWYNAYEESIHVECLFSNPKLYSSENHSYALTSHIDIAPTLISLAGIDQKEVAKELSKSHTDAQPLVGRNLSKHIVSAGKQGKVNDSIFLQYAIT